VISVAEQVLSGEQSRENALIALKVFGNTEQDLDNSLDVLKRRAEGKKKVVVKDDSAISLDPTVLANTQGTHSPKPIITEEVIKVNPVQRGIPASEALGKLQKK
jgi:hypothetical protein